MVNQLEIVKYRDDWCSVDRSSAVLSFPLHEQQARVTTHLCCLVNKKVLVYKNLFRLQLYNKLHLRILQFNQTCN